jgi:hypothetical protein
MFCVCIVARGKQLAGLEEERRTARIPEKIARGYQPSMAPINARTSHCRTVGSFQFGLPANLTGSYLGCLDGNVQHFMRLRLKGLIRCAALPV